MLFFKRILKEPEPVAAGAPAAPVVERRGTRRYAVSPQFPLKAVLSFVPRDDTGAPMSTSRHGWNWKGTLVDCSEQGARIKMGPTLKVEARDLCDLILAVDDFELTIPCHISNLRETSDGVMFGLSHDLGSAETAAAYGQLLEVLALGSTLKLRGKAEADESGYLAEHYTSNRPARLSVWRRPNNRAVVAFEFQLKDNLVRGVIGQPMEFLAGFGPAAVPAPTAKALEIQRLFNWVLPNVAPAVPEDVRDFLARYRS